MHILLIHQAFAALDEPGGTRHHELSRYLAAQGNQVTIIASPVSYLTGDAKIHKTRLDLFDGGGRVRILRAYTYRALHRSFVHRMFSFLSFMVSSFVKGLGVKDVDLVWGTSPPIFQGLSAWLLARMKRVPFLFEVRDLWPSFAVQVGVLRQPLLIHLSEWLESFLYRHADTVMVNSPGFIPHIEARRGCRVVLVPNGTDPGMFDPGGDGAEFRREHNLGDKFIVLYAGAHGMSNDLGVLLASARILVHRKDIIFLLLGDGKEKPSLVDQAKELNLLNVRFLPPLEKNRMSYAFAGVDACIAILKPIPLYATVYPNKVFDYMAAGRPVILAIDGVIRQVVEEAESGIFVEPGHPAALAEAVLNLAGDPQKARWMGQNGRRYVETHFDRAKIAADLTSIMEQMTRKKS
jgi:glycosyltransferase involved in cell wall biosynthesis